MSYYSKKKEKLDLMSVPAVKLLLRLLAVLLLFSLSRWLVYLLNTEFFNHLTLGQSFRLLFVGMRFDGVVLAYANLPLILLFCLPLKLIYNRFLQSLIDIWYVVANSALILLNMIDVVYFRYVGSRMTSDCLKVFDHMDVGYATIAKEIFTDYWYMLVMMILIVLLLIVVVKRTRLVLGDKVLTNRWYFTQWVSFLVFLVLTIIACRGGLQSKPINRATALQHTDSQNIPILLNTFFTMVKVDETSMNEELHWYDPEEMDFSPIHYSTQANRFVEGDSVFQPNLVYLVLESVGQEMVTYYHRDRLFPITPFLDSLLSKSLTFDGRANGRRSFEEMPSLLSGLPALTEVNLAASRKYSDSLESLGMVLRSQGYRTKLYELRARGKHPSGKEAFDGPSLQSCLRGLNELPQPFAAMIHTGSTAYPYTLPHGFEMPEESYVWSRFEKSVYYTDHALRDFFKEASSQPWFDSTLFVITADHANNEHYQPEYNNIWGMYSIPIAFYMPSRLKAQRCEEIAQQIDLNVSILSALGINDTVFSFGRNVFDSLSEPSFIAYINLTYQYSDGNYLLQSDGEKTISVFNIKDDRLLNDNLIDRIQCPDLARKLRERIQEYRNRLVNHQLFIDKEAYHEQTTDTVYHQSDLGQEAPQGSAQPD